MKRQKRILAGAAAMLLALGMLIGCDTPANSGSTGGDITLPAGDSTAENKLVGTWGIKDVSYGLLKFILSSNGICNITEEYSFYEGIWSATKTDLSIFVNQTDINFSISLVVLEDEDKLYIPNNGLFERTSGSAGSIEGTWELREDYTDSKVFIQCMISNDSFELSFINTSKISSAKVKSKVTGSRKGEILTVKEGVSVTTYPYRLSDDNTLILNPDTEFSSTYTKQQ